MAHDRWQGSDKEFTVKRTLDGHISPSKTYEFEGPDDPTDASNPHTPDNPGMPDGDY